MKRSIFIGEVYTSNNSGDFIVIDYLSCRKILIKFLNNGYERWVQSGAIMSGKIQNKYTPTDMGVGFLGEGEYKFRSSSDEYTVEYSKWHDMLYRCYSPKAKKCYNGVFVCKEWHNFQTFAKWMNEQKYNEGWQLDKDLLDPAAKCYSPETCIFLPAEINSFLSTMRNRKANLPIGVSKQGRRYYSKIRIDKQQVYLGVFDTPDEAFTTYIFEKKKVLNKLAYRWKNLIDDRAFNSLINLKIY